MVPPVDIPHLPRDARRTNLPVQATSLIGREREVAAVVALLRRPEVRLVTLTGPGGTGKTRLGLQVAAELLDLFPAGVYFVPLASLSDPALVASAIAGELRIEETGAQPLLTSLYEFLRDRRLLLVLDNFEHLLDAAALVADLLGACPRLAALVTSRGILHLSAEHEYPVLPLALPDPQRLPPLDQFGQYDAVTLFVERARAARPDFQITAANAPAVVAICHRLDGLPLAIELAAARVRLLPPQTLLARLEHRLPLLTGGARDRPLRQQTLRGTIDWSYQLLGANEQALFARLAVFAGSCSLETAEAVCASDTIPASGILEGLAALVDQSLLRQWEGPEGEPRFAMLATIREYAAERLAERGEAQTIRRRHAEQYVAFVREGAPQAWGPQQTVWRARLDSEHDNLRAALAWTVEYGEAELGLQLVCAVFHFWRWRGSGSELHHWLTALLAGGAAVPSPLRAQALLYAGLSAWEQQADRERACVYLEEALALYRDLDDRAGMATAIGWLGRTTLDHHEFARSYALLEESLARFRELGDRKGSAWALAGLGALAQRQGDYERARALQEERLALYRRVHDHFGVTHALMDLGRLAVFQGAYGRARQLLEEVVAAHREQADPPALASSLDSLGWLALIEGDHERAQALLEESLSLYRMLDRALGVAICLNNLGLVALHRGDYQRARPLLEESLALCRERGAMPIGAEVLRNLALLAVVQDDARKAVARCRRALSFCRRLGSKLNTAACLEVLAGAATALGDPVAAVELFGSAEALREMGERPPPPAECALYERWIATARAQVARAAFATMWARGRTLAGSLPATIARAEAIATSLLDQDTPPPAAPTPALPERPATSPFGLSGRELEVLQLVAQGLTDAQVAERLFLSRRTVSTHLQSVYGKLGVNSRSAATRLAVEHNLG